MKRDSLWKWLFSLTWKGMVCENDCLVWREMDSLWKWLFSLTWTGIVFENNCLVWRERDGFWKWLFRLTWKGLWKWLFSLTWKGLWKWLFSLTWKGLRKLTRLKNKSVHSTYFYVAQKTKGMESLCHRFKFSNPYTFATWQCKPLIFQT